MKQLLVMVACALALAAPASAHVQQGKGSYAHRLGIRIAHDRAAIRSVDKQAIRSGSWLFLTNELWQARVEHARDLAKATAKLRELQIGVPAWFWQQAMCVHSHEGSWLDTGDPYWGGMQFSLSTWHRAGGSGLPSSASPAEQIYRAYMIWKQDGGSWREWPATSRICGLR